MANLPEPHPTQDLWGEELNEWLQVGHNPDGTNKGVATIGDLADHTTDTDNPHDVTAAQTGAYTTGQTDAAITAAAGVVASDLAAHEADTANPHNVTKAQVQLGNVPNVDATQRSNHTGSQAIATVEGLQSALDAKADVADAVPDGGVLGQVLMVDESGKRWASIYRLPTMHLSGASSVVTTATHGQGVIGDRTKPLAANTLYGALICPPKGLYTRASIRNVATASVSGSARLGIGRLDLADPLRRTVVDIQDFGVVSTATIGAKEITNLSIECDGEWYVLLVLCDQPCSVRGYLPSYGLASYTVSSNQYVMPKAALPYGPLPGSVTFADGETALPGANTDAGAVPQLGLRMT